MILMFGDVHGQFKHVLPIVQAQKPAAIIFLGDLDLEQPFEKEVADVVNLTEIYFIHGNHDTDTQNKYEYLFNSSLANRNLHGRIVLIDGVKVAGLGGVFREKVWGPRDDYDAARQADNYESYINSEIQASQWQRKRNNTLKPISGTVKVSPEIIGKMLKHKSTIFYDDWIHLYSQEADILVTHEAPCCHPYGFAAITELARGMKVKKSFHGHHHDRRDYSAYYESYGFKPHGVGLCGVSNQDGDLIKAGLLDHIRL